MSNAYFGSMVLQSVAVYPRLRRRFKGYIKGVEQLPEGFTANRLFFDYLKARRQLPEKRLSLSEYMIFAFYRLSEQERREYLTDTEATLLMRPYNAESEPYLKDKVLFLRTFADFIHRDWLYLPESTAEDFAAFVRRHGSVALKPPLSSWGIGFRKLTAEELSGREKEVFEELSAGGYLAEEFLQSDPELAKYHPESLNTLRIITFRNGERFTVFGAGLRVGNHGLHVDNAHGGGIFCELDPDTGRVITDGLDEHGNSYSVHPMTGVPFRGQQIPHWPEIIELCRKASQTLPCLHVVGWDVAVLPGGELELIEGNHNPGMNIVQAPYKHGVRQKFAELLLDFYGPPELWEHQEAAAAGQAV